MGIVPEIGTTKPCDVEVTSKGSTCAALLARKVGVKMSSSMCWSRITGPGTKKCEAGLRESQHNSSVFAW